MDLAAIKKEQDLNKQLLPLEQLLIERRFKALNDKAAVAAAEFRSYFEQNGFVVKGALPGSIIASYGSAEFALEFTPAQAVLTIKRPAKDLVQVRLVGKGYKGPTVTVTSGEQDLIKALEKRLSDAEASLAKPDPDFDFYPVEKVVAGQLPHQSRPQVVTFPDFTSVLTKYCA